GQQLNAHSMYGGKGWGKVGLWENPSIELRGWGDCSTNRAERYRANLAHGAATAADLDGDGTLEVVATGNMYDCANGHPPGKYTPLFIFNGDRSRFQKGGWDWREPAKDTGAPLSEDYGVIENNQPNPVVADLDGDGKKEVLFSSYDGRLHAFWLDKKEHHNWPSSVYHASEGFYRFASEPVVADLDANGKAEVIFVSWVQKQSSGTMRLGKLHVLDYMGNTLYEINLPLPRSTSKRWNGALAAPTIANIDSDPDLELVVNTVASGFVAYDLPGSSQAKILWRTGRNKQFSEISSSASVTPLLYLLLNK
ncbi:MAG: VCBS repeat-containing protein, partial [Gammaproteobacteria bacterium]|nr:VCBS repeat-containing protein [Gammaproteobacteria bacterium]